MGTLNFTRRSLLHAAPFILSSPALAQPVREVRIGLSSSSFGASGVRVANELGLFTAHGLAPKLIVMDSGNAAIAGALSGSLEFAMSGPGEVIAARARGQKLVMIVNGYRGLAGTLVLSKAAVEKAGIAADAPLAARFKALDDLIIGSPSATSVYTVALKHAIKAAGAGEPRFTYMGQPAMVAALESGAIHGFIAGAPFWAVPVLRGVAVSWVSGPKGELPPDAVPSSSASLVATEGMAVRESAFISRFVAVFTDLGNAIRERPDEVRAAVARLFPELDNRTLDLLVPIEAPAWAAGLVTRADVEHDIAFVRGSGVPVPNLDQLDPASLVFK